MSKSKDIGTRVETAVVKAAHAVGLHAARPALAGINDVGDVHINRGQIVVECKGGKMAASASLQQIRKWVAETEMEASRVMECDAAVLVVKRGGTTDPRQWRAFTTISEYLWVTVGRDLSCPRLVEMPLGDLLDDIAQLGRAR